MLNALPSSQPGIIAQQSNTSASIGLVATHPQPRPRPTSLQQKPSGFDMNSLTNTPDSRLLTLKPSNHVNAVVAEILSLDNLPEVPDDLKTHISAYVQRARELSGKDPVMCYWCLYFAAKRGVIARTSRPWLFKLMDALEMVKKELKDDDAVASEDAGHAYIENFALKVFSLADGEDQGGNSTRSTAKKFLAAANFFEMLTVFDAIPEQAENEDKIKYAKWKAASIARNVRDSSSDEAKASSGPKSLPTSSSERRKSDPTVTSAKPTAGPKMPIDLLSSDRYLAPPQQKGASPSIPSSFGSLPASAASSTNPSPSSAPQVPLPVSPNVASDAKLPNPRVTPSENHSSPDPPTNKSSAPPPGGRTIDEKISTPKTPIAAPSGSRPRRETNEGLPKSSFFASIAGKMFGFREGQLTPDVWSNQATPGTEIQLPPTSVLTVNGEAKGKSLSRTSLPPAEGAARSLLGGTVPAIVPSTRDDTAVTSTRPSVTPSSNRAENGKGSESRKPEYTSNPPGATAQTSVALGPSVARKNDVSPLRDPPTAGIVRPSPPSQPEVTVISLIPEQTMPNLPAGSQRLRRASEDKQQGRRDESHPMPSRVPETDQGMRRAEYQGGQPLALPAQPITFARVAALKRVHFSGSVVGGLSTDAGTSPPPSPTELKQNPPKTHVGFNGTSLAKQETPGSSLRRRASDSASRKPQLLSTTAPRLAGVENTSLVVPQEDSIGSSMGPSVTHSRHLSDSLLNPPFSSVESDPSKRSPRRSPNELSSTHPLSVQEARHRSHSVVQSSLVGSAGSYNTMTLNRSPSRTLPSAPPPSSSPKTRPMQIPPISKTLPPTQQQQPTPSPSPPSVQPLSSPVSYTAVPATSAPIVMSVSSAISVPPVPIISTSPSFTQTKPAATHVATPYTRPQDLPAALTAEVMLNARKHTKYAMSALEFDDVETARKQLRLALERLEAE